MSGVEFIGWYYNGRYYDSVNNRFVDGIDFSASDNPINTYALVDNVEATVEGLLRSTTYGTPRSYTSNWYSNLSTIELLARLIYGETMGFEPDQNAVGYVLLNRFHGNDGNYYGSTMIQIGTATNQFMSIVGNSTETVGARSPALTSNAWEHVTYIAVSIALSDNTISDCEDLFYRPSYITNHTQFRSYGTFISRATQGNGCIRFNGHDLSSVVLPSVGSYTTIEELEDDYANGFSGECNVYFMY